MLNLGAVTPPVAMEIGEGYASAVRVNRKGSGIELAGYKLVKLPEIKRSGDRQWSGFIMDERFVPAMEELLDWIGKAKRISIAMPDLASRTFFLEIENPGVSGMELRDIILFKIQKFAPISGEGTALAYKQLRPRAGGGGHYLAVITSRSLTSSYERFFSTRGTHLGRIETASLVSLDLFFPYIRKIADGRGDFVIIRIANGHFTVALFNHLFELTFCRTRTAQSTQELPGQITHEIKTLSLFSQDKLGGSTVNTAFLYGPGESIEETKELLSQSGSSVSTLSLGDVADLPNELLYRPEDEGRIVAAVAVAARR